MKTILSVILLSVLFPLNAFCETKTPNIEKSIPERQVLIAASDAATPVPGAPAKLSLDTLPGALYLDWKLSPNDPGIVTGYEIMRATDYRGPYDRIGMVGKGVSHYEDLTVSPKVVYFYKVRAVAGDGYSPFSNAAVGEVPPY